MIVSDSHFLLESGSGYCIVALLPALNDAPWADIEKTENAVLEELRKHKAPSFLVDLSSLNYMGSAMVTLVVRLWKSVKDQGGQMVVVNQHDLVLEVLRIAGLHKIWTITPTREQGLKELGLRARPGGKTTTSKSSQVITRGRGTWLAVTSLFSLIGGAAGLYLLMVPNDLVPDRRAASGILYTLAGLGLILGMLSAIRGATSQKVLGTVVALSCVGLIVTGALKATAPAEKRGLNVPESE